MIDFTGVTEITIPEGNVTKITCGTEVLWNKPSVEQEPVVVFPAMAVDCMPEGSWSYAYDNLTFIRPVSAGEKYIIYVDGNAHAATASVDGAGYTVLNADDGHIEFASVPGSNVVFNMRISGWEWAPVIEIHYIP